MGFVSPRESGRPLILYFPFVVQPPIRHSLGWLDPKGAEFSLGQELVPDMQYSAACAPHANGSDQTCIDKPPISPRQCPCHKCVSTQFSPGHRLHSCRLSSAYTGSGCSEKPASPLGMGSLGCSSCLRCLSARRLKTSYISALSMCSPCGIAASFPSEGASQSVSDPRPTEGSLPMRVQHLFNRSARINLETLLAARKQPFMQ